MLKPVQTRKLARRPTKGLQRRVYDYVLRNPDCVEADLAFNLSEPPERLKAALYNMQWSGVLDRTRKSGDYHYRVAEAGNEKIKNRRVTLSLTDDESKMLKELADQSGKSAPELVRELALENVKMTVLQRPLHEIELAERQHQTDKQRAEIRGFLTGAMLMCLVAVMAMWAIST